VTAVTFQGTKPRRSLIGKLGSALAARANGKGKPSWLAARLTAAREHMVTVAAFASGDVGMFHWGITPGCIALMVSLLALDFAVTG
jgi:hypothetical protein